MVNKDEFRCAMSMFATGVTIVTTLADDERVHGITVNSFTSISLTPPLIAIAIDQNATSHKLILSRKVFGVNILAASQQSIAQYFAMSPKPETTNLPYQHGINSMGVPIITDSLAFLGCHLVSSIDCSDHTIFIGRTEEVVLNEDLSPLIYYKSQFITKDLPN